MLRLSSVLSLLVFGIGLVSQGMGQEPRSSPPAVASVQLNGKEISIAYSRPAARGRKIMGGVVPYGQVWRTGANEATLMKTAMDLEIGSVKVPAGTYSIYTLPSETGWKLIINKQTGQWGTEYDPGQDLARVDLTQSKLSKPVELFTIELEKKTDSSAALVLSWELTKLTLAIKAQ